MPIINLAAMYEQREYDFRMPVSLIASCIGRNDELDAMLEEAEEAARRAKNYADNLRELWKAVCWTSEDFEGCPLRLRPYNDGSGRISIAIPGDRSENNRGAMLADGAWLYEKLAKGDGTGWLVHYSEWSAGIDGEVFLSDKTAAILAAKRWVAFGEIPSAG